MSELKEAYQVVAERPLGYLAEAAETFENSNRICEDMGTLQTSRVPTSFAHELATQIEKRKEFPVGPRAVRDNLEQHAQETIRNLRNRRDEQPQSLHAGRAEAMGLALADTEPDTEEDLLEMESPLSSKRYGPKPPGNQMPPDSGVPQ